MFIYIYSPSFFFLDRNKANLLNFKMAVSHRLFKPKKMKIGRMATKNLYKIRLSLHQKKNSVGSLKGTSPTPPSTDTGKFLARKQDRVPSFLSAEGMRAKKASLNFKGNLSAFFLFFFFFGSTIF